MQCNPVIKAFTHKGLQDFLKFEDSVAILVNFLDYHWAKVWAHNTTHLTPAIPSRSAFCPPLA
jgi:hypothetical protein